MTAFEVDHQTPEMAVPRLASVKIPSARVPFHRRLYVQVLVAVALGAALGYAFPDFSVYLKPFGDAFIKAIKVVVAPIIFTTIALGIAKMRDIRHVANVGIKALIYFEVASTLALMIGMIVGNVWQVGTGLNADPAAFDPRAVEAYAKVAKDVSLTDFLLSIVPSSFIEPFVKGRWYQVGEDGSQCDTGHVLVWEPPKRLILAWQLDANWTYDPKLALQVEVNFTAEDARTTRVDLEHRDLEQMGDRAETVRSQIDGANGWTGILEVYRQSASK